MVALANKNNLNLIPIKFDYNDYIVGYLYNNNSELYEMIIPYNSESIDIEFHSDKVKLLVYIENNRNILNYDDPFVIKSENMFNINTKNISDNEVDNIKIKIYVCIDNDYLNEPIININNYSYFSFKIHINRDNYLNIYKIKANQQKILCKPKKINGRNVCLFIIELTNFV